jgi:hypothetical protein
MAHTPTGSKPRRGHRIDPSATRPPASTTEPQTPPPERHATNLLKSLEAEGIADEELSALLATDRVVPVAHGRLGSTLPARGLNNFAGGTVA